MPAERVKQEDWFNGGQPQQDDAYYIALRVEVGARALRNQTGGSEFSGLWVRSLECVCRALKTGNDRKKE